MFTVIARFPAVAEHQKDVFEALDRSLEVARNAPGLLAYQVLQPKEANQRVGLMIWETRDHFQKMLQSEESRAVHAEVKPEYFDGTPRIEELEVVSSWHSEATA